MNSQKVVLKHKDWFKIVSTLSSIICIVMGGFILYKIFGTSEGISNMESGTTLYVTLNTVLGIASFLVIIIGIVTMIQMKKKSVALTHSAVSVSGLFSKEIPYEEIQTVKVGKGTIEIAGDGLFNRVGIGDLYKNFPEARKVLVTRINDFGDIRLKGSDKYIEEYFGTL